MGTFKTVISNLIKELYDYIRQNKWIVPVIITVVFLAYGYELSHFVLTIDEEANFNAGQWDYFQRRVSDGRFTIGLIKILLPNILLPFWSTALFVIAISISAIMLGKVYYDFFRDVTASVIISVLFISMPIHAYYVMFSQQSFETAVGYLLCILSFMIVNERFIFRRANNNSLIVALAFLVLANGVYQAFFMVFIFMVCSIIPVILLTQDKNQTYHFSTREIWELIIKYVGFVITSVIVYGSIVKISQLFTGTRNYVENFMLWGANSPSTTIKNIIKIIYDTLCGQEEFRGYNTIPVFFLFWVLIMLLSIVKVRRNELIIFSISMIGMLLSNFLMIMITANKMPPRTMLSFPIFGGLVLALITVMIDKVYIKKIVILITCILVLYQSAIITDLFWNESKRADSDYLKATVLVQEISELGYGYIPDIPVILVNSTRYGSYDDTFGYTYFDLGRRLYGYLGSIGFDYVKGNEEQQKYGEERARNMSVFPADGSVVIENDTIIVNFVEMESVE